MKHVLQLLTSLKTTVALICLMSLLLLVSMVVPQRSVVGDEEFARLVTFDETARFFLVTLGLGSISTSPLFLAALVLFFANLAAVLAGRARPTWRRIRFRPRPEAGLRAWAKVEGERSASPPEGFSARAVVDALRGFGYRPKKVGEGVVWGVKHRTAALGFLLFHLSFFLLCGGGVLLYYTRFVGSVALTEGQEFDGESLRVQRHPPAAGPAVAPRFILVSVDPRFERGEPTHLGAVLRFQGAGMAVERGTRINAPAAWGAARIYVQQAGLTPVFWLQDEQGFTLDRVAAAVSDREPSEIPLDEDRLAVVVTPPPSLPEREDLAAAELAVEVLGERDEVLFRGTLRKGQAADLGGERLVLEAVRYWAGLQIISERGGGLLIAGFLAGVAGLVWRLLLHRREVAVVWSAERFTLVGRSEYFPWHFRQELDGLFAVLERSPEGGPAGEDEDAESEGGESGNGEGTQEGAAR